MQWINIFSSVSKKNTQLSLIFIIIIIITTTIFCLSSLLKHKVTTDNLKRLQ